jgi:hypothetical protein
MIAETELTQQLCVSAINKPPPRPDLLKEPVLHPDFEQSRGKYISGRRNAGGSFYSPQVFIFRCLINIFWKFVLVVGIAFN